MVIPDRIYIPLLNSLRAPLLRISCMCRCALLLSVPPRPWPTGEKAGKRRVSKHLGGKTNSLTKASHLSKLCSTNTTQTKHLLRSTVITQLQKHLSPKPNLCSSQILLQHFFTHLHKQSLPSLQILLHSSSHCFTPLKFVFCVPFSLKIGGTHDGVAGEHAPCAMMCRSTLHTLLHVVPHFTHLNLFSFFFTHFHISRVV